MDEYNDWGDSDFLGLCEFCLEENRICEFFFVVGYLIKFEYEVCDDLVKKFDEVEFIDLIVLDLIWLLIIVVLFVFFLFLVEKDVELIVFIDVLFES